MEDVHMTSIPRPRFDTTLNYGHVVQSLLLLITIVGGFVYLVQWQSAVNTQLEAIAEMRKVMIPAVDILQRSDALQDQQIAIINKALDNIQDTQQRAAEALAKIGTSVAVIEERTKGKTN